MPRHHTTSPICTACRLRCAVCACAHAPRLDIATRLVVIVHAKEWGSSTNTGHLMRLALSNADIRRHGLRHQTVSSDGIDPRSPSTLVLFPGRGAQVLTKEFLEPLPRPLTLVVPDGNWIQAKNMMRRLPMLSQARRVCLDGPDLDLRCLRQNFYADRMSTFEAIAQALGIVENEEIESRLLAFLQEVLRGRKAHQLRPGRKKRDPS